MATVTWTFAAEPPMAAGSVAVMVELPTLTPVTVIAADCVAPAGMVTVGTLKVAACGLEDARVMVAPPAGAGWLSCRTKVPVPPGIRDSELGIAVSW